MDWRKIQEDELYNILIASAPNQISAMFLSLSLPSAQTELNLAATLLSLFQISYHITTDPTTYTHIINTCITRDSQIVIIEREMME